MSGTRDRLLDAGEVVIASRGLNDLSIPAICETAGLGRGAVNYVFTSRANFLVAIADRAGEYLAALPVPMIGESFRVWTERWIAAWRRDQNRFNFTVTMLVDSLAARPEPHARAARAHYARLVDQVEAHLRHFAANGHVRADLHAEAFAPVLTGSVLGLSALDLAGSVRIGYIELCNVLETHARHGVRQSMADLADPDQQHPS